MIIYFILALATMFGVVAIASIVKQRLAYAILVLWGCTMMSSALTFSSMQGQPKSTTTETRKVEVAQVLWSKIIVNEKILLILTWKDLPEPVYYSMPWPQELEKELPQAQAKSISRNTPLMIRNPFSFKNKKPIVGDDGKPGNGKGRSKGVGSGTGEGHEEDDFYAAPPPPSPVKDAETLNEGST